MCGIMTRIYIAGPLFSKGEREFNKELNKFLIDLGYETFLPQNDGHELSKLLDNGYRQEKANEKIFNKDLKEIEKSDVVVFVMDGRVPDEGACVEIGYAYSLSKECIGIKTDVRSLIDGTDNPMVQGVLKNRIVNDFEELEKELNKIKEGKYE